MRGLAIPFDPFLIPFAYSSGTIRLRHIVLLLPRALHLYWIKPDI
jgi:hypothetical protein